MAAPRPHDKDIADDEQLLPAMHPVDSLAAGHDDDLRELVGVRWHVRGMGDPENTSTDMPVCSKISPVEK